MTDKERSLLPLMFITYGLQYLDKITLGYAAVLGLREDAVSSPRVMSDITDHIE